VQHPLQREISPGAGRCLAGWACATLVLLAACQPQGPTAQFDDYLTRLGRTLAVDVPAVERQALPVPPRTGQLQHDIPPGSLDALDFLALSGCAVQVTIGKRNSSLGRMAKPSQRLLLELEYLQLAPDCIAHRRDNGNEALAADLEQAWQLKRQQLPALIFNATLGGEEYRAFWRAGALAPDYPGSISSEVPSALLAINNHARRWLAGDYQANNRDFEILLSAVAAGDGGALYRALHQQDAWLSAANRMLDWRMARGPLCSTNIRPAAADILPNVIRNYFIETIQLRAAGLNRRNHELLPPVTVLEEMLGTTLPAEYRAWRDGRNSQLDHLVQAPRRHVEKLIAIQEPCMDNDQGRP